MNRISVPWKSWVLVCDGSKALMFQNVGDALALNLKVVDVAFEPHPASRELGTERPPRVHESMGNSRSAVRSVDLHQEAEATFLRGVAARLDEVVRSNGVKHLILVAAPRALGVLRDHLTPGVRAVLAAEVAKDLARLPTTEIEKHLTAMSQLP
jgi:protein required for attachment to host cells